MEISAMKSKLTLGLELFLANAARKLLFDVRLLVLL